MKEPSDYLEESLEYNNCKGIIMNNSRIGKSVFEAIKQAQRDVIRRFVIKSYNRFCEPHSENVYIKIEEELYKEFEL